MERLSFPAEKLSISLNFRGRWILFLLFCLIHPNYVLATESVETQTDTDTTGNDLEDEPLQGNLCNTTCNGTSSLQYQVDTEYVYNFEATIQTLVNAQQAQSKKTNIKAEVLLIAKTPCSFVLKVKKLAISNDGSAPAPVDGLEVSGAQFTLEDGVIGSFCVRKDEPAWTANVKRAVVSLLQNKALSQQGDLRFVETDISGRCPTSYTESNGKYTKSKVLNECSRRDGGLSLTYGVPYDTKSANISSSGAFLNSIQQCNQFLENGTYLRIHCSESHTIRRFNFSQIPDVKTIVETTLELGATRAVDASSDEDAFQDLETFSILFDHVESTDAQTQAARKASMEVVMKDICTTTTQGDLAADVIASLALKLRNQMENLSPEDCSKILAKSLSECKPDAEKLYKIFVAAAIAASNEVSIPVLADVLKDPNQNTGLTETQFFATVTFARAPGVKSLKAFKRFISRDSPSHHALFAASGLAHRYCKVTNAKCGDAEEYKTIVDRLGALAETNCLAKGDKKLRLGFAALEALGNVDHLTPVAVQGVKKCLFEGTSRVRFAALKTMRRNAGRPELKHEAFKILRNETEDVGLRIAAFILLAKCSNSTEVDQLQVIINEQSSRPLSSYIHTYLESHRPQQNSSPSLDDLQRIASNLTLSSNDQSGFGIKNSRHFSYSYFNESLGLGYALTGDVIQSINLITPSFVAANLSIDLFGTSYNVLDITFEDLGEFEDTGAVLETSAAPNSLFFSKLEEAFRKLIATGGHFNIRVLGTTLASTQCEFSALLKIPSIFKSLWEIWERYLATDESRFAPTVFQDIDESVPTSSGFKLDYRAQASSVWAMETGRMRGIPVGSMAVSSLNFAPNLAVAVQVDHRVVSGPFNSGLQLDLTLQFGSFFELSQYGNNTEQHVDISCRYERILYAAISTDVYWVSKSPVELLELSVPYSQSTTPEKREKECQEIEAYVNRNLTDVTGLSVCYSKRFFPVDGAVGSSSAILSGKQHYVVSLEKSAAGLQAYRMTLLRNIESDDRVDYSLKAELFGFSRKRELRASLTRHIDLKNKYKVRAAVETSNSNNFAKFESELSHSGPDRYLQFNISATPRYSLSGSFPWSMNSKGEYVYKPLILCALEDLRISLFGTIVSDPSSNLRWDFEFESHHVERVLGENTGVVKRTLTGNSEWLFQDHDYQILIPQFKFGWRQRTASGLQAYYADFDATMRSQDQGTLHFTQICFKNAAQGKEFIWDPVNFCITSESQSLVPASLTNFHITHKSKVNVTAGSSNRTEELTIISVAKNVNGREQSFYYQSLDTDKNMFIVGAQGVEGQLVQGNFSYFDANDTVAIVFKHTLEVEHGEARSGNQVTYTTNLQLVYKKTKVSSLLTYTYNGLIIDVDYEFLKSENDHEITYNWIKLTVDKSRKKYLKGLLLIIYFRNTPVTIQFNGIYVTKPDSLITVMYSDNLKWSRTSFSLKSLHFSNGQYSVEAQLEHPPSSTGINADVNWETNGNRHDITTGIRIDARGNRTVIRSLAEIDMVNTIYKFKNNVTSRGKRQTFDVGLRVSDKLPFDKYVLVISYQLINGTIKVPAIEHLMNQLEDPSHASEISISEIAEFNSRIAVQLANETLRSFTASTTLKGSSKAWVLIVTLDAADQLSMGSVLGGREIASQTDSDFQWENTLKSDYIPGTISVILDLELKPNNPIFRYNLSVTNVTHIEGINTYTLGFGPGEFFQVGTSHIVKTDNGPFLNYHFDAKRNHSSWIIETGAEIRRLKIVQVTANWTSTGLDNIEVTVHTQLQLPGWTSAALCGFKFKNVASDSRIISLTAEFAPGVNILLNLEQAANAHAELPQISLVSITKCVPCNIDYKLLVNSTWPDVKELEETY